MVVANGDGWKMVMPVSTSPSSPLSLSSTGSMVQNEVITAPSPMYEHIRGVWWCWRMVVAVEVFLNVFS